MMTDLKISDGFKAVYIYIFIVDWLIHNYEQAFTDLSMTRADWENQRCPVET